jgi:hypothetical protein
VCDVGRSGDGQGLAAEADDGASGGNVRESGSAPSGPAMIAMARSAPARSGAKIVTQSSVRHAGTTPRTGTIPRVALIPTMPPNAA